MVWVEFLGAVMTNADQGPVRWLLLGALLLGAAVWYSWTAHREPEPPTRSPALIQSALEVESPPPAGE